MRFYLPAYEECKEIVESNPHGCFYERRHVVDDYEVSIFSYRHAKYNNFIRPLENPIVNALEMKGIVFVFNDDGSIYKRYLMLPKFWEVDQYKHSMYDLYRDKLVKNITIKEDGFLVSFIKLPNGDIISNTKNGFHEEINARANKFLENKEYYDFINNCISNDIRPIFELTSVDDMFVKYDKSSLMLTKLRCNKTGDYLNTNSVDTKISKARECNLTFDEVYNLRESSENVEGWVVQFYDNSVLKIKTKWWSDRKARIF